MFHLYSLHRNRCCGLSFCVDVCPFTKKEYPHQSTCSELEDFFKVNLIMCETLTSESDD